MNSILKWLLQTIPRPWLIRLSLWFRPLIAYALRGNQFTDPIDGKSYRKFLPYGYEKQRENVLAPGTLSLERHRLLWLYLRDHSNFFTNNLKVLHVAPEQAFFKKFKKLKNLDYTSTDLESPIVDVKADICDLPFEDNSYDVILCNHVLEHIPDDAKAMSELYRVMKPNGWGIFQVPIKYSLQETYEDFSIIEPEERRKHFGQYDHVRVYGMDYYKRLEQAGFKVEKLNLSAKLSNEEIKKFALEKNEILPLVRKV